MLECQFIFLNDLAGRTLFQRLLEIRNKAVDTLCAGADPFQPFRSISDEHHES